MKTIKEVSKDTSCLKEANDANESAEFGFFGKLIVGAIGFAVAGPVGMAVASGATCLYDNSVTKGNTFKKVEVVKAIAEKESADKNMFAGIAVKSVNEVKILEANIADKDEYIKLLEGENEELRAEIAKLHEQINNIYS